MLYSFVISFPTQDCHELWYKNLKRQKRKEERLEAQTGIKSSVVSNSSSAESSRQYAMQPGRGSAQAQVGLQAESSIPGGLSLSNITVSKSPPAQSSVSTLFLDVIR